LVGQAKSFLSSNEFNDAIKTAQYILINLDADSQEAKGILLKAQEELKTLSQTTGDDVKKALGSFGK